MSALEDYLDMIDIKYIDAFDDWRSIVFACKNLNINTNKIIEFSKKSINYTDEGFWKIYNTAKDIQLGIQTIKYYAKQSNPIKYNLRQYSTNIFRCNDKIILEVFIDLIRDDFIYTKDTMYIFYNNRWNIDTGLRFMTIKFMSVMETYLKEFNIANEPIEEDYETGLSFEEDLKDYKKSLNKVIDYCSNTPSINNVMSLFNKMCVSFECEDVFDNLPYIFSFKNTGFNLKTKQQLQITKDMFITQNTRYDYVASTTDQMEYLSNIISKILPDEETRQCLIDILYSGMIGISPEKFIIFNGNGRNGKGVLNGLFSELLGQDYSYKINSNVLTKDTDDSNTANPAIVQFDKKRYVFCEEFEEKSKLNLKVVKTLTGGGVLKARDLHKTIGSVNNNSTLILECNLKPELSGEIQNSIVDRIVDIPFKSTFTSNIEQLKEEFHYKLESYLKKTEFVRSYKCVLFDYLILHANVSLEIPSNIQDRTLEYLGNSDEVINWIKSLYELDTSCEEYLPIKELYNLYAKSDIFNEEKLKEKNFKNRISINIFTKNHFYSKKQVLKKQYYAGLYQFKSKTI